VVCSSLGLSLLQKAPQQLIQLVVNTHQLCFHLLVSFLLPGFAGSDFCFHLLDGFLLPGLAGSDILLQVYY